MLTLTQQCHTPEATQQLAATLGTLLQGGEVLAMRGDLGAGKTCFVQGLAQGLDVPPEIYVRSPTFSLLDEYPGRHNLFHLDLYRLDDEDELEAIGWRECLDGTSVVAIEWAERIQRALPLDHIDIHIALDKTSQTRSITFIFPKTHTHLADQLQQQLQQPTSTSHT